MANRVFKLRWIGLPQAIRAFENELNAIARESTTVVKNTAATISRKAASALKRGKYKAYRTGELSGAHTWELVEHNDKGSLAEVHNDKHYAYFIHNGTKKGITANPWLRAMVNKEEAAFTKKLVDVVKRKKTVQIGSSSLLSFNSSR